MPYAPSVAPADVTVCDAGFAFTTLPKAQQASCSAMTPASSEKKITASFVLVTRIVFAASPVLDTA
jgi:hypothetical protein